MSAFTFTHLVALFVATRMYMFHVNLHASLIGPTKSKPHFIKGSFGSDVTSWLDFLFFVLQFFSNYFNFYKIHEYL
jgi:hypothetical protein